MKASVASNLIGVLKIRLLKFFFPVLFVFSIIFILSESVQGQGCSVVLKISDPAPVCSPLTVDLTAATITSGSTEGLKFSYYLNPELTISLPNPESVGVGTYYIKGILTGSRTVWVASTVKVTVYAKPNLVITPSILISPNEHIDLTLPSIKSGSDEGIVFSYWLDIEATKPLLTSVLAVKGVYYIKGILGNGCFDIKPITIDE